MTLTPSMMVALNTPAPDFTLQDTNGRTVSLKEFAGSKALLVAFLSHHCPYTRHILPALIAMVRDYQNRWLATVAINSNDPMQHEEDRPENIAKAVKDLDLPFKFLIDPSQEVAKSYQAACTPDFFLYDANRKLVYRGRFDDSRPDNEIATTGDQLRAAIDAVLSGKTVPMIQKPSVGCNIKWRPGNEPEYFLRQQKKSA